MSSEDQKDLAISSWAILGLYLVILLFGTLDFVRVTTAFATILDQLGGELSWKTRVAIQLSDGLRFGLFLIPLIALVAFLVFKEIRWKSKVRALIVNNVVFLMTLTVGYSLRLAMIEPMMNIIWSLSR